MDRRVAIVGTSFRFPGTTPDRFWQDLLDNRDLVTEVSPERWSKETYLHPDKRHPGTAYTFAAGSLGDISGFDAQFFGISPREAANMDPQQRLLLEMSWEAIESAGIAPSSLRGSDCGVFMGIASVDYAYRFADDFSAIDTSTGTGTASSIGSNRISYLFDLHGPSVSMDTACSSSMMAFHQACRSILSGETDMALTGGISLHLHPYGFMIFSKATMLSHQGRCQVFDAAGDGYVRSEGGGVFLLKEYSRALADGDPILAVVAGTAVNTDGYKSGLTVPNPQAQIALMRKAYREAGISADEIDYLEAHGTGTAVGDPIETRAIGEALGQARSTPLPIGSVKSNVGHLETASGVAGLAKALYAIRHRVVPATISMKTPNPKIRFDEWNIEVVSENRPLKAEGRLVVGVNSFGFGGANAHVILASPPEQEPSAQKQQPSAQKQMPAGPAPEPVAAETPLRALPLRVSARSSEALKAAAAQMAGALREQDQCLYDLAWSSLFRREHHAEGLLLLTRDAKEAAAQLSAYASGGDSSGVYTARRVEAAQGPAFIYSGNGCQWETMGRRLLSGSATFRAAVAEVDRLFSQYAEFSLLAEMEGANGSERFIKTEIAQPTLFALQVGITEMLREQGIAPLAVAGHSVGEVAAAWACGALSLADAVKVIYYRSYYQGQTAGRGEMTAVGLGADAMAPLLQPYEQIALAGINSSRGVTLAGCPAQLGELERQLAEQGTFFRRLDLDYAFHSPLMEPIREGVIDALASIEPKTQHCRYISTVTGEALDGRELGAEYWWLNIRQPVLFQAALDQLIEQGINCFVEIGAHPVLRSYLNDALRDAGRTGAVIGTLSRYRDEASQVERAAAQLMLSGAEVDYRSFFPVDGQLAALPHYPWQRESYWHQSTSDSIGILQRHYQHPLLGYRLRHQTLSWESQLDTQRYPWLADHKVGDAVLFPGAGFIELALAAAQRLRHGDLLDIEELEILGPLLLDELNSKVVRLTLADYGQLRVASRDQASTDVDADQAWNAHLKARILEQSRGLQLQRRAPELPLRPADFDRERHQAMARAAGLDYGPAFQAVSRGWIEGDTVIGVIEPSAEVLEMLPSYHMHPGILDSSFQLFIQLLAEELQQQPGMAYVPVRAGRIQFNAGAAREQIPGLTRVRLRRRLPHSLTADFEIFDRQGKALLVIEEARFKAVRLHRAEQHELSFLDYHLTPAPLARQGSADHALISRCSAWLVRQYQSQGLGDAYAAEVEPLLDSLVQGFAVRALRDYAEQSGAPREAWAPLAQRLCVALESLYSLPLQQIEAPEVEPELIWNALVREYPQYFPLTQLAGRYGQQLPRRLAGAQETLPMADQAGFAALLRCQCGQAAQQLIGSALAQAVRELQGHLGAGRRLRVLEVGAAAPLFGQLICDSLDAQVSDYAYASHSPEALEEAQGLGERFPGLQTIRLDLERGTVDAAALAADLVLVNLEFVSLADARQVLALLPQLTSGDADLLLFGQHKSWWMDQVLGLDEQWWIDERQTQQATPAQWKTLLNALNYRQIEKLYLHDEHSGPYLIRARAAVPEPAEEVARQRWCLLADPGTELLARQIEAELQQRGQNVVLCLDGQRELEQQLTQLAPSEAVTQLVLLRGLGDASLEAQVQRSRDAIALATACETHSAFNHSWLLTQAVAAMFANDQPVADAAPTTPSGDASLWGFGRTLMNEFAGAGLRLLDLPATLDAAVLQTLVDTLLEPPAAPLEQELLILAEGGRFAPRLRLESAPGSVERHSAASRLTLGFSQPGQLRHLQWFEQPLPAAAEGQVEIEVKATGLNFRDVMYTLGLLSDEAIENGFSGPSLGLEFAGRVTAVGAGVSDYRVGDRVVGFGPASFSTRLVTGTEAIAQIPEGIDFEAAATIPTTFFTVYYALKHLARLEPGERILIHGAAGGVGVAAIQIAQLMGAEIYATVGSQEKRDFVRLMGVEHIYDSRALTFAEEILAQTPDGRGVDLVLNSLAGEAINQNLRVLKPFGRFLELGKRDFYENTPIGLRPFRNNLSYFGIDSDQLMKERPELTRVLFAEMMQLFHQGELHPLPYTRFGADQVVDAFRFMQQARQIGKVVIGYERAPQAVSKAQPGDLGQLTLCAEASYLVTGGLGGFGLRTARWLADKGARTLLLASRSGTVSDEARATVEALQASGVSVHALACDVTDRAALAALLARCESGELPPLKGIVHAAAVIEDALAVNLDAAHIRRVYAPKIAGALNLHELTQGLELQLFVLFSSATTLFGNPGQSCYVAANHWLEALTALRRRQGLVATCARWGAIDDVGFLARNEKIKDALQGRMGGAALHSDAALAALERMILADSGTLGVLELDWTALARFLPSAESAKFVEIARGADEVEQGEDSRAELARMLLELTPEELHDAVVGMLKAELSAILLVSEEKIDADKSVYDMGFDSLMGVELMAAIETRFGIQLPVMALSESPTLGKLAEKLIQKLHGGEGEGDADEEQVRQVAAQHGVDAKLING